MRPTWAEISRGALLQNYRLLRERAAAEGAELLSVIKANAYGHGLEICGPVLAAEGAEWLGVSNTEEGVRLREILAAAAATAGLRPRILLMGGPWKGEGEAILEHALTPVVWEPYQLDVLEQAARRAGLGNRSVAVHLEIDTGMARQGVSLANAKGVLERLAASPTLRMEGLLTHYASPDVRSGPGSAQVAEQTGLFCRAALMARHMDLFPQWVHAGQSATIAADDGTIGRLHELARGLGSRMMARPGLGLYGYALDEQRLEGEYAPKLAARLQPVLRWKSRVNSLRSVPAGATAGYNALWVAPRASTLALLPVGYADGFWRAMSGRNAGEEQPGVRVRIKDAWANVVGRVSMDLIIVDVTDVPGVAIGDEVELLGEEDARVMARRMGTIPYEILCGISSRVPRVAVE